MGGGGGGGGEEEGGVWAFAAGASEGGDGDYEGDALHSEVIRSTWVAWIVTVTIMCLQKHGVE